MVAQAAGDGKSYPPSPPVGRLGLGPVPTAP